MADKLKQLAQRIKNSADKRYALKEEVTGGGGSGIVVNSNPIVSYISEDALNAKIANKVAELALLKSDPRVVIQTVVKWNMTTPSNSGVISFKESNALSGDVSLHGLAYVEPKNWLIASNWNNKLRIYDADTYTLVKEQTLPYNLKYIISTYDGKRLLIFNYTDSNYADIYELNEATNTYEKKYSLPNTTYSGTMNYQGDKIVSVQDEKLLSYSMNTSGNWELKSSTSDSKIWRGVMIHQEFLYAFTTDGKLWRGTYIDGVIGTMEEQVCDIPTDKSSEYNDQAYMTMDGSIIYKIDYFNSSISTKTGKVYVFAKQDDDSWKLIENITSSNPASNQLFGVDMCMNADNSKAWVIQYTTGAVDRFDIASSNKISLDANSTDPFEDGSLKHFYKLDGDVTDSVGTAHGTINGAGEFIDAKYGKGFRNTSTDDNNNIVIPNHDITPDNLGTISTWMSDDYNNHLFSIGKKGIDNKYGWAELLILEDGILPCYRATNGTVHKGKVFSKTALVSGLNHIVAVYPLDYNSREFKLYINGVEITDSTIHSQEGTGDSHTTFEGQAMIAGYSGQNNHSASGIADHLQVFNRALTQEEVTKLYGAEASSSNDGSSNDDNQPVELNATNANPELLVNNKFETASDDDTTIPKSWILEAKQDNNVLTAKHIYQSNTVKLVCSGAIDSGLEAHQFESKISQNVDLSVGTYELYMKFNEGKLNSGYTNVVVGISIKIGSKDPIMVYALSDVNAMITIPNEIVNKTIDLLSDDLASNGEATKVTIYTYLNVFDATSNSGGNNRAKDNFITIDELSMKLKD